MSNPYDTIGRVGLLLAVIGAINWLLVGLFEWNLAQWIFTQSGTQTVGSLGERIVYIVVGVGGVLAVPMLAATLSRARGRDVRSDERDESGRRRTADTDDTAFYMGAPKDVRAEDRSAAAEASTEGRPAERSGPVRRVERVIVRTEEPIVRSNEPTRDETTRSDESTSEAQDMPDRSLRYGSVEEADDDLAERRAA